MSDKPQTTALDDEVEKALGDLTKDAPFITGTPPRQLRPSLESGRITDYGPATVASQMKNTVTALEAIDRDLVALGNEFARQIDAIRKRLGVLR